MSLHWLFSGFEFLILCFLQNRTDFAISSPKLILSIIYYLLSTNQSHNMLNFLFSAQSILVIALCWNIKQVPSAYSNSSGQILPKDVNLNNKTTSINMFPTFAKGIFIYLKETFLK